MGMTLSTTAGTGLPLTMNQLEAFDPAVFEEEGGPYEVLEVVARTYGVQYELATYYDSHPEGDEFAAVLFAASGTVCSGVTAYDADGLRVERDDSPETLHTLAMIAVEFGIDPSLIGEYVVTYYG